MENKFVVHSKVILHEDKNTSPAKLKQFFLDNNLIGYKAINYKNILEVMETNIDLGAIFISQSGNTEGKGSGVIVKKIHSLRPELPIFLSVADTEELEIVPDDIKSLCAGVYIRGDFDTLKKMIDTYIFNMFYPSDIIRSMIELTEEVIPSVLLDCDLVSEAPYLVRDRIIYGKLFSLIPLESHWCRGYMMMQADEEPLVNMVKAGNTHFSSNKPDIGFREVNGIMSELTNLIWGKFKTKFYREEETRNLYNIQVPIIVNHMRKYITFGSETPQLCFHYTLKEKSNHFEPLSLYQKFIFHLNWNPEKYNETESEEMRYLIKEGGLVLF